MIENPMMPVNRAKYSTATASPFLPAGNASRFDQYRTSRGVFVGLEPGFRARKEGHFVDLSDGEAGLSALIVEGDAANPAEFGSGRVRALRAVLAAVGDVLREVHARALREPEHETRPLKTVLK